jgi:chromatin remodeling complex protein RSC6
MEQAPKVKKTRVSKKKKTEPDVADVVVEPVPETPVEEVVTPPVEEIPSVVEDEVKTIPPEDTNTVLEETTTDKRKRNTRVISKQTVAKDFEELYSQFETDYAENKTMLKRFRQLKTDSLKIMRVKNENKKIKDMSSSGFMKPIQISDEMAKFIGVDNSKPIRRVDVTKYLCDYIKQHDLQKVGDRRFILPNEDLKKLLRIEEHDDPLTYYTLQRKLKIHIA